MAWLSMLAGLLFPLLILGTESPTLGAIAAPFYVFVGAVVGAYIGFATYEDTHGVASDQYQNSTYSRGSESYGRTDYGVGRERMASQWEDRPDDGGAQPGTGPGRYERYVGDGSPTETKGRRPR